jgi:hypothetical protein
VHVRVRFGDVPVLLRNSKDQKVRKQKVRKDGIILLGLRKDREVIVKDKVCKVRCIIHNKCILKVG